MTEKAWNPDTAPASVSVPVPAVALVSLTLSFTASVILYSYAVTTGVHWVVSEESTFCHVPLLLTTIVCQLTVSEVSIISHRNLLEIKSAAATNSCMSAINVAAAASESDPVAVSATFVGSFLRALIESDPVAVSATEERNVAFELIESDPVAVSATDELNVVLEETESDPVAVSATDELTNGVLEETESEAIAVSATDAPYKLPEDTAKGPPANVPKPNSPSSGTVTAINQKRRLDRF
jgi:hypothetical protein